MLGVLLESHARRPRRSGGAALSVATHIAIIGAVSVASARGAPATRVPEKPVIVHVTPPPASRTATRPQARHPAATAAPALLSPVRGIPSIVAPTLVPTSLPSIDLSSGASIDSLLAARPGGGAGRPRGVLDGTDDAPAAAEWRGTELMMRMLSSAKPRYPESLRQARIDGRVLIRFVVDTAGAIDLASVQVLSSTHELFTRAVRDILPAFRFKPAEVGGHRVRSLAEMPFEFVVR